MRAVILDVSGVLRDNEKAIWQSYERVLRPLFELEATPQQAYRLRGFAQYNLLENAIEALYALSRECINLEEALKNPREISDAVRKHALQEKLEWAHKVKKDFRRTDAEHLREIPPLPHSKEALVNLSSKYRVGVVSNSGSMFNKAWLNFHDLSRFVSAFVGEEDVSQRKPAPDGILQCTERLFTKPSESYYVGDSQSDIIAALNAQARPVGVLSGTANRAQLEEAGAWRVYENLFESSKEL